jgi:micrococcal nuclease
LLRRENDYTLGSDIFTIVLIFRYGLMINKIILIISVAFFCFGSAVDASESFSGTVKKVIDGDSLIIAARGMTYEVRLYGLDAPEYNQPFADDAKEYVKNWVDGNRVTVYPEYVDSYKRTVAVVVKGHQVLNRDLVEAGFAWVSPRYCHKDVCRSWTEMEERARHERKGLWQDSLPVSPWIWKRSGRRT